jgi:hypothetical protein
LGEGYDWSLRLVVEMLRNGIAELGFRFDDRTDQRRRSQPDDTSYDQFHNFGFHKVPFVEVSL